MKILPVEKIREADAFTIENEPIDSVDLMERVASKVYDWFMKRCKSKEVKVKIFCGIGNNGGDGLALARMLYFTGVIPQVFVVHFAEKMSRDCEINFNRLKEETETPMYDIFSEDDFPKIYDDEIIIDAIFGSGLNRIIEGFTAELIKHLNDNNAIRIAIDIPSGIIESQRVNESMSQRVAETPSQSQQPTMRVGRLSRPSTISITKDEPKKEEVAEEVWNDVIVQERLTKVWDDFANAIQTSSPIFGVSMKNAEPTLVNGNEIHFKIDNILVIKDQNNMHALHEYLKTNLHNNQFILKEEVLERPREVVLYTDKQKFEKMASENSNVISIKESLNLQLDI